MKKNDLKSARGKDIKELEKIINDKKSQLGPIQVKIATGEEKNTKKGQNLKIDIAQLETVMREKEITQKKDKKKEDK